MKTFSEYLLTEIGDSKRIYPTKISFESGHYTYTVYGDFKADSGLHYTVSGDIPVNTDTGKYFMEVNFATQEHQTQLTNAGLREAFKVVATVVNFVKTVIPKVEKKYKITLNGIIFTSADADKIGQGTDPKKHKQRDKLYLQFIKKELKIAKISKTKSNVTVFLMQ